MNWYKLVSKNHLIKCHICPESLVDMTIIDLNSRLENDYILDVIRSKEWSIDLGGMMIMGQPEQLYVIDNLSIHIPCDHVSPLIDKINRCIGRSLNNKNFYKLHHWIHATVLEPSQKDNLFHQLESTVNECEEKAIAFLTEKYPKEVNKFLGAMK